MTWNIILSLSLFFSFFFILHLDRPLAGSLQLSVKGGSHECARERDSLKGRRRAPSRQRLPRLCLARRRETEEPLRANFVVGSFSRRHAVPLPLLLFSRSLSGHPVDCVPPRGDSAATGAMHSNANNSRPGDGDVIVAISCFSEIQPAYLTSTVSLSILPYPLLLSLSLSWSTWNLSLTLSSPETR